MSSSEKALELTLISAKDLKKVNLFSKLEVYAVAGLSCDPRGNQRTLPDREGLHNPSWNVTLRFPIPASADPRNTSLYVLLRAERSLGDRHVGVVHVPFSELELGSTADKCFVSYQVLRPSGRAKGVLNFSYRFANAIADPIADPISCQTYEPIPGPKVDDEPVMGSPAYPQPYPPPSPSSYLSYTRSYAPPSPSSFPAYTQPYAPPSPSSYPAYTQPYPPPSPSSFPAYTQPHAPPSASSYPAYTQPYPPPSPSSYPTYNKPYPLPSASSFPAYKQPYPLPSASSFPAYKQSYPPPSPSSYPAYNYQTPVAETWGRTPHSIS